MSTSRNTARAALVALFAVRCSPAPPTPAPFTTRCDHRACPSGQSIVVRAGMFECASLGATETAATARWPMLSGPADGRRYVDPGAPAGGDGRSEASPYQTIAESIASGGREVALASGAHTISTTLIVNAVQLVGVGSGAAGTVLRSTTPIALVASGATSLSSLRFEGASDAAVSVVRGGSLSAREVVFDAVGTAVRAEDAHITLRDVTVRRATARAISVTASAIVMASALESVLVEDGAAAGIVFEGAAVNAQRVSVRRQQRDGFALLGRGFAARGQLSESSFACNGVTGFRVQGAGAELDASTLYVAGTRAPAGTVGGDGVFVHDGARLSMDGAIAAPSDADQGRHSLVLDNERVGLLIDGRNAAGEPSPADFRVLGARVEGNGASGVFLQRGARASVIGYSVFERNRALGVGMTTGSDVVEFRCDVFRDAQPGQLATSPPVELGGDGLSAASSTIGLVLASRFEGNGRFAAVFTQSNVRMFMGNRGMNNGFTVGAYASTLLESGNDVRGAAAPTAPPVTARDTIGVR
jgi:hypothetical protein